MAIKINAIPLASSLLANIMPLKLFCSYLLSHERLLDKQVSFMRLSPILHKVTCFSAVLV